MAAAALLADLHGLGVAVEARGDRLALRPASVVPPALLAAVRTHKAELLALLARHRLGALVARHRLGALVARLETARPPRRWHDALDGLREAWWRDRLAGPHPAERIGGAP